MTVRVGRVAEVFVEIADTLVDEFDLIEFLQMVTAHTSELASANAAGLLLADHHNRLQMMAASSEEARLLELFQVQADEGPCQDCFRNGTPVVNADLTQAASKWPQFAPRAVDAGFRSVHAFPLRLRQEVIGALNVFGTEIGTMGDEDVRVVQALADVATIGLLQERAVRRGELLTEQLQAALNTRVTIEQAKGALAQLHDQTPDQAFELLRTWSRRHGRRLSEVAHAVVADPDSVPALTRKRDATSD
jgi:transcriptional regulator with GAF, ATPase, and Fis domain